MRRWPSPVPPVRLGEPGVALPLRARALEAHMSSTDANRETPTRVPAPGSIDMKLEVVTLPVSDVDRAKAFYQSLGWRLDGDLVFGHDIRAVQLTPPRSNCSISFGKGLTTAEPGSAQRFELVVADIEAAREDLVSRGVQVSELFHRHGGELRPGPDPERRSYLTYASFSDPDGNSWLLQEVNERPPGRDWEA
jgi:catechol 2,3-dioxygenase-like lactoylglutathione lyase family enzyme